MTFLMLALTLPTSLVTQKSTLVMIMKHEMTSILVSQLISQSVWMMSFTDGDDLVNANHSAIEDV